MSLRPRHRRLDDGHQGRPHRRGRGRARHRREPSTGTTIPAPLWSEQDPALWWDGAVSAIGDVLTTTGTPGEAVAAVGLTGQMHGLVVLDEADTVLRPAILWNDQRTAAECDLIRAAVGPERLIEVTGNDALPGFTAPKLVWVRDHEPATWRASGTSCCPRTTCVSG